ncbi:MAG: hypothetical protein HGB10_08290 [Coriobacteriia bacterium]|nr:hypothetical protein [Coriobacteriia bacterium]
MRYGEIIKKAWRITWTYKWLWVLGIFAGITGGSSGGGSGGGGSNGSSNLGSAFNGGGSSGSSGLPDMSGLGASVAQWLPVVIIFAALLVLIGIAFAVLGIGARGGLIWAVDEIEQGRVPSLGEAWSAGFARFWRIFGLGLLLQLPIAIAALLLAAVILVPILGTVAAGGDPNPALILGPMCGALIIGVPVLLVAAVVLGVMYITGTRFVVLNNMGVVHSAKEAWRALRARIMDHIVMYVISAGLSIAASLVLVVPIVIVGVATLVPAIITAGNENWGAFAGTVGLFVVIVFVLSIAFSAIWGTFTSALWTVFFRRLTGREPLAPVAMPVPAPAAPAGYAPSPAPPAPAGGYAPPVAPTPPTAPDA